MIIGELWTFITNLDIEEQLDGDPEVEELVQTAVGHYEYEKNESDPGA